MKMKYQGGGIFVDKSNIRYIQSGRILGETENWYGSLFDSLHLKIKRICIHLFRTTFQLLANRRIFNENSFSNL